ncbi:helix-turn-helix domain-containing protein [Microbacterium foliorum]|uniref:Helix-turn-helix domain protein n=1 Tax=Microbacterium foliorum TaxID=104336 RepID=A0A0F0KZT1_9MICO|nr:helix-turn-helix domain-containing protein [Microbacterium foliorum]AXL12579.1 helix-turn-helix domain-containing protein [Microbacterium foliorum]KJL26397.1 Helix-turn-helix domain protein [Microbacterium foliorum]
MTEQTGDILVSPLRDSREIAAFLRVSESTLSRWRAEKKGPPFIRIGGVTRYRIEQVEHWLASLGADEHA